MKITIEKRLNAKGDKQTIRMVYWYGSHTDADGKIKHDRKLEQLDLYLFPKPATKFEKQHNKETLQLVEQIKSKRIAEEATGQHGFTSSIKSKTNFYTFYAEIMATKTSMPKTWDVWQAVLIHLKRYCPDDSITFERIDEDWVKSVRAYFDTKAKTKSGNPISSGTASTYFNKVRAVINEAVSQKILVTNPLINVAGIKPETGKRVYLSIEEVRALVKTDCRYDILKEAFLFSCLTGLRWSDINKLEWSEISEFNGNHRITFNQQKTGNLQYLDIPPQAYSLIHGKGVKEGRVFATLKYSAYMNVELLRWALSAGISKHVTFHSARHTFAVSLITQGVDIYTISKLMGHTEVKTTQIYADVIDSVRKDAMFKIPDIGL
jgi:integrase/recombinase XerD